MTGLRILATSDLGAATVPLRTSTGASGTCAGVVSLLERERERLPVVWLEAGDLVVGHPSYPLLGERPWAHVAGLPIAAASAGNHDFDDGVDALRSAAAMLGGRRPTRATRRPTTSPGTGAACRPAPPATFSTPPPSR